MDRARKEVGTVDSNNNPSGPQVILNINGNPYSAVYVEQDVGSVTFVPDNSFDIPKGNQYLVTAGFWALITTPFRKLVFGGKGGRLSATNATPFETQVTYELRDT
jgi:hypothetical protein